MSPTATLETSEVTLEAGGEVSVPLTLRNDGDIVNEYWFRVVGQLKPWAWVDPPKVSVYPGTSVTVEVGIRVPRTWNVPAGVIPYGVQVLPTERSGDTTVVEGVAEVRPFHETTAELAPRISEGRRKVHPRVTVGNRGNAPSRVQLTGKDPKGQLDITIQPPSLTVDPGRDGSADVTVRPADALWRGGPCDHQFTVEVAPEHQPPLVLAGTYRQEAHLAPWFLSSFKVFPALFKGSFTLLKLIYALLVLAVLAAVAIGLLVVASGGLPPDILPGWIPLWLHELLAEKGPSGGGVPPGPGDIKLPDQ
ncbi:hypothetical protein MRU69_13720 [Kocuria flava]|uniref:COG1470 family protein n=1 Tax=Kocuria flava TaxID=446860 RepID=UPI001FF14670|nr:hypothetical protein [Kocuria flava]MCJ8505899.1 hypothetical protein [Kocuria flava]